jgi:hypothetical protein
VIDVQKTIFDERIQHFRVPHSHPCPIRTSC